MIKLNQIATRAPEGYDKRKIKARTELLLNEISDLQIKMNAAKESGLLIILQGLDASGKDGVIRNIFSKVSPFGVSLKAFGPPTEEEYSYDFLWRVHKEVPAKGMIKIFNRSHYEDILVPGIEGYINKDVIEKRFEHINAFERLLDESNTKILKFYLHVSKEKQRTRLLERLQIRRKHYKHHDSDWTTREKFEQYQALYERIINECNVVPWHVIPSDQNWIKTYEVAKVILRALKDMDLVWPELNSNLFTPGKIDYDKLK
ncbi:polyphosphate:AMP phosphotransferase [Balneicella halophila]|uniref:Polyphosphate:AMP phosphotransferase n=1 Tax=Balneicella halophila TaxID=1537566 RepID=A0A7L4UPL8_BALHA|nr:PPK2 family polyphosphate kinase [Balneicella halophila]PVX50827.1 polyphosphate:AMP phosphotransferase [Balneicella halophila]